MNSDSSPLCYLPFPCFSLFSSFYTDRIQRRTAFVLLL